MNKDKYIKGLEKALKVAIEDKKNWINTSLNLQEELVRNQDYEHKTHVLVFYVYLGIALNITLCMFYILGTF